MLTNVVIYCASIVKKKLASKAETEVVLPHPFRLRFFECAARYYRVR